MMKTSKKNILLIAAFLICLQFNNASVLASTDSPSKEQLKECHGEFNKFKKSMISDKIRVVNDKKNPEFINLTSAFFNYIHEPSRLFAVERVSKKKNLSTTATNKITADNIEEIFKHEYKDAHFGAKGLITFLFEVPFFWKTGEGVMGIEVHHRDVIAQYKRWFSLFVEHLEEFSSSVLSEANDENIDFAYELLEVAESLSNLRNNSTIEEEDFCIFLGVQLTAKRFSDGKLKITRLDIDSSMISSMISKDFKITVENAGVVNFLLAAAHNAISSDLIGYKSIGVLKKDAIDPNHLLLPPLNFKLHHVK